MIDNLFDLVLCALIIFVAFAAVSGRDLFAAIVFFIVYGLMVAIAWLRLEAIDVALAEAAIGAGLTGVLLLGAYGRLKNIDAARMGSWVPLPVLIVIALAAMGLSAAVGVVLIALDPNGLGLIPAVNANIAQSGVFNPVTAVLLNFRAYDTLLEWIVLVVALVGVWTLADNSAWGQRVGKTQSVRANGVLQSFGRTLPPIGLMIGIYFVWAGSSQPGGAFQGGTILAAVGLLSAMAGLFPPPRVNDARLRLSVIAGPILFLAVAIAGTAWGGMFVLPADLAYGLILAIEIVLALSIAITLMLLVLGPPEMTETPQ